MAKDRAAAKADISELLAQPSDQSNRSLLGFWVWVQHHGVRILIYTDIIFERRDNLNEVEGGENQVLRIVHGSKICKKLQNC